MDNEAPQTSPERAWQSPCWTTPRRGEWRDLDGRTTPRGVAACERGEWFLHGFPVVDGVPCTTGDPLIYPFRCKSWRCRRCSRGVGIYDAERIAKGLAQRESWWYLTLTFDPKEWGSKWDAYRASSACWSKGLRRWIQRRFVGEDGEAPELAYVQTWEKTKNGWPHVNLIFHQLAVDDAALELGIETREVQIKHDPERTRSATFSPALRQEFKRAARRAGFGEVAWMEQVSSPEKLAWYVAKTAMELAFGQEKNQTPDNSPPGFRRIRPSQGLLEPREAPAREVALALETTNKLDTLERLGPRTMKATLLRNWTAHAPEDLLVTAIEADPELERLLDLIEPKPMPPRYSPNPPVRAIDILR